MSYRFVPTFKCYMCGREEPARIPFIVPFRRKLPDGWRGSTRRSGVCYCERCCEAISELMDADYPREGKDRVEQ